MISRPFGSINGVTGKKEVDIEAKEIETEDALRDLIFQYHQKIRDLDDKIVAQSDEIGELIDELNEYRKG